MKLSNIGKSGGALSYAGANVGGTTAAVGASGGIEKAALDVGTAIGVLQGMIMAMTGNAGKGHGNDESKSGVGGEDSKEKSVGGSKKHGVNWKEGPARAKATGILQGQWAKSDLDFATEMANTLKPGESGYFDLPEGSKPVVHMPDGITEGATKIWIRNNGTGTWHEYPMR